MIANIVTPVDGSATSWTAARVGASLAGRLDVPLTLLTIEYGVDSPDEGRARLERRVADEPLGNVDLRFDVRIAADSVAAEIQATLRALDDPVVVMASHGRGRSSAIVGSVTEDVIRRVAGPVLLVGPHVEAAPFTGPVLVAVDGSDDAETGVPVGVAWAAALRHTLRIVQAVPPETTLPVGTPDTAYVARLADRIGSRTGTTVGFDEIPGNRPAADLTAFADRTGASMIVATTHGRTGFDRLVMGSVAAGMVRRATCPVLLQRVGGGEPPAD